MAHTNQTTNYHMSQFLGTDKPAWLTDYNTDMSTIDSQMKTNADNIVLANNLAQTAKTTADQAEEDATDALADAATAQQTANTASSTASIAQQTADGVKAYLSLSTHNDYAGSQFVVSAGGGAVAQTNQLFVSHNSEGSLAKVYGTLGLNGGTAQTYGVIQLNVDTGLRPATEINIQACGICVSSDGSIANADLKIKTNGYIEIRGYRTTSNCTFRLLPIVIFVEDFGD